MKKDSDKTKEQLLAELAELRKKSKEQQDKLKTSNQQLDANNQQLRAREKKLKNQKERLNNILEGTNVGTWEWNVQTGETVFNEKWANIIGYTLNEISPVSIDKWMKFAHPDDLKKSGELLEKHFNGELDYYHCEGRMKHKNGSWIWVLDRGKVITRDDDGKPLWVFGTHQDITERKKAEDELKTERDRLQKYYDATLGQEEEIIRLQDIITNLGGNYE